ncbi:hypothetical protein LXD69_01545 [Flavobacterium sediminilitoris]|uniref:YD repeat-containing protein n=1 Tax=Flavobacterium sediminilitoris TaxID=2024526 RepID=A0ABY4HMY2_9FLAO|nr:MULTISPECIES: hypothetical protein [Flavobacterium]UOX34211.1 hypothetical protein LXD69_01545 [Flavobacterium sediminilitoris]
MRITKLLTIVLISALGFGQNDPNPQDYLPNIIPPSPEAYALGNYGNIPVGLFTGSPNVQIPLLEFKTKSITIPFSLSYSSNGIKIDDVNSKVGLGWNLIGGGVINRVIRDQPDENENFSIPIISNNNYQDPLFMQSLDVISENEYMDSERDLFSYSFNGNSGQFVFNTDGSIVHLPQSDLKIEVQVSQETPNIYNFKITDPFGVIYFFEEKEQTMLRTSGGGHSVPNTNYTAWYLSKIKTIDGLEIYLNYSNDVSYYVASQSQQLSKSYPSFQYSVGKPHVKGITYSPIYSHHIRVIGKRIESIESNNPMYGKLFFTYNNELYNVEDPNTVLKEIRKENKNNEVINKVSLNYLSTNTERLFLQEIISNDPNKKYSFEYIQPNAFPARLSFARDEWGYFNGITSNVNLIPKVNSHGLENTNYNHANQQINPIYSKIGLLSKIFYPTKGYSSIEYESNDYLKKNTKVLPTNLFNQLININSNSNERNKTVSQNIFTYFDHRVKLTGSSEFYNCDPDLNVGNNKHKTLTSIFCVEDNEEVRLFKYDQWGDMIDVGYSTDLNFGDCYFYAKENKTYTVSLKNNFNCTRGYTSIEYYKDDYTIINQNINVIAAGNRVKSIIDYNHDNMIIDTKRYYYSKLNELNTSSGIIGLQPFYASIMRWREAVMNDGSPAPIGFREFSDLVVSSSSLNNMYVNGNNIYYSYVTISYGGNNFENGAEEKQFMINKDYFGKTIYNSDDISGAPFTNFGWNNGFEIESKSYTKKGSNFYLLKKQSNNYFLDETKTVELINFATRKKYDEILEGPAVYTCNSTDVTTRYPIKTCTTNHNHIRYVGSWHCIVPGANNVTSYINHPCYGRNVGDLIPYYDRLDNADIVEYKNISYRFYLKNKTSTDYFYDTSNNLVGQVENTIINSHNSPNHLQQTTQTIITSSPEETLETKYSYAHEQSNQALIDKNMIAIPLKTEIKRNGVALSSQETQYRDWGNGIIAPEIIKTAKGAATAEDRIKYNALDNTTGNPLEVQQEGGQPITYIWGYNKTLPIAKIENATYAQVQPYEVNLQTLSNGTDEASLITALNNLRTVLPNAMITTYTHKPLIGVSTMTDSKGNFVRYHYDPFNRLEFVTDKDDKVVSENKYHYKN